MRPEPDNLSEFDMLDTVLLYLGSATIFSWGIAHIFSTRYVMKQLGKVAEENRKIIPVAWITMGLTICFIGIIVFLVNFFDTPGSLLAMAIYLVSSIMLLTIVGLTELFGSRTAIVATKLYTLAMMISTLMIFMGSVI